MEIRQLRYFVGVCDTRSFTRAAAQNGVTQSALSQSVRELERQLGQPLLQRENRASKPTEAGEVLLAYARVIVAQHDQADAEMKRLLGQETGRIRLGLHSAFPRNAVFRAAEALKERYEGVRVEINSAAIDAPALIKKLGELTWDLAVTAFEPTGDLFPDGNLRSELVLEPLSQTRSVVCAAQTHPLHDAETITARDLCSFSWAFASPRAADQVSSLIAESGGTQPIRVDMQSDTFPGMLQAVAQTNMLCFAPVSLIDDCGLPVRLLNQDVIQPYKIEWGLFTSSTIELSRPVRYLRDCIVAEARKQP